MIYTRVHCYPSTSDQKQRLHDVASPARSGAECLAENARSDKNEFLELIEKFNLSNFSVNHFSVSLLLIKLSIDFQNLIFQGVYQ